MFYGKEVTWKEILKHAEAIAEEQGMILVYGATMGSISRGIPALDSDYDIRFLFLKKDNPMKVWDPKKCLESDIVYRYFRDKNHRTDIDITYVYDRMAFWELTSFLQLLVEPQIGTETWDKNGLYYVVEHTFLSPYTWDPYGIQQKVMPFIYRYAKPEYSVNHFREMIEKAYNNELKNGKMGAKDYLDALWAALSLQWIRKNGGPSPVDFGVLLTSVEESDVRKRLERWGQEIIEKCNYTLRVSNSQIRGFSRYNVFCKREDYVERVVSEVYDGAIREEFGRTQDADYEKQYRQVGLLIDAVVREIMNPAKVLNV